MTKVLILYYSSYGHIETMASAVAEGVRETGAEAVIKRVTELVPEEIAGKSHFKLDQAAPIATVAELPDYDAIIIGVPTRFGNMPAQMKNFLDQTGGLWMQGKLIGKVGSVFTSTASQHGGQESTHSVDPYRIAAPRHGDRWSALFLPGSDGREGRDGWIALWRDDDCGRRWIAAAIGERIEWRALPGSPRRSDRIQAPHDLVQRFRGSTISWRGLVAGMVVSPDFKECWRKRLPIFMSGADHAFQASFERQTPHSPPASSGHELARI